MRPFIPYRYDFYGQKKDNELSGVGNTNTAEFWVYDYMLDRRFNVDPVFNASEGLYICFGDDPIVL